MQFVSSFLGGYQKVGSSDTNSTIHMDEMGSDSQAAMSNLGDYNTSVNGYGNNGMGMTPTNSFGISTLSVTPLGQQSPTTDLYSSDLYAQESTAESIQTGSGSWLGGLWGNQQQDEMATIYDVETQTTIQQPIQHEQDMPRIQRWAIKGADWVGKRMPDIKWPELTYTQKLTSFILFSLGGVILLLNALMNFTSIFFGKSGKFALSLSVANIFFIIASLFITAPSSHFQPNRRFTTFLYLGTIVATVLASIYTPYAIIVLPILAAQLAALVFHILSFFTSAVNVNMNIGQSIVTSMFRRAL